MQFLFAHRSCIQTVGLRPYSRVIEVIALCSVGSTETSSLCNGDIVGTTEFSMGIYLPKEAQEGSNAYEIRTYRSRKRSAKQELARALEETGFVPVDLGGPLDGGRLQQFGRPLNALHMALLNRMQF